ncbi:MAG: efflux RND transporter permease subunit [Planctomycetes bacterium]|nr:efflux RND transporter permease subunit [Planctomycetota bacterium]
MIERIIAWSLRNRMITLLLVAVGAVYGVFALQRTPVDAIPDLSENQVIVFADWPGRSPQEIEDQVTYPLSVALQGLAGVKAVRSSSEFNFAMVDVIFDDGIDFYFARTRVLERLTTLSGGMGGVTLPAGVVPSLAPDATALGQIFWYTIEGENRDLGELRAIQDWTVRYQLQSVPGVVQVASVGGMPREWQVDVDPERLRGYGVTLGEVYGAISRSNAAVGGRVVQKGNAEYLVRGVGWVRGREDIEDTVVTSRDGVPVRVKDVATVQLGSEFRRSVLEKSGREAVGGVVMMRYGENPLEVTRALHAKIRDISPGLPEGVRIVPFYERTRLVESAISNVTSTLLEEMLVASLVILFVMLHIGASLVVCITLPLAVLGAFILMHHLGVPSNIMSLSGIAISIGVLVDQAIVLTDNAMHHLREKFGDEPVRGDIRELLVKPCQDVGRPVFFAILIMVISFLPVFALGGIEGKMFHPLAWTKTFALVSVGILTITLLPAILPVVLKGRMRAEEESWLVRSVVVIYRPVLEWLMERHRLVIVVFAMILGTGWVLSGKLGREFMPPLDEGSILDMPVTVPRASVTQVTDDLRARDAVLRSFPEVESVVGKSGRADTPTDPSPLDMVETIVNLRPRAQWPRRHLRFSDAAAQAAAAVGSLADRGLVRAPVGTERDALANDAAMFASEQFDRRMRDLTRTRQAEAEPAIAKALVAAGVRATAEFLAKEDRLARPATDADISAVAARLEPDFGRLLVAEPLGADVQLLVRRAADAFVASGVAHARADLLVETRSPLGESLASIAATFTGPAADVFERVRAGLKSAHERAWDDQAESVRWELEDIGPGAFTAAAVEAALTAAKTRGVLTRDAKEGEVAEVARDLSRGWRPYLHEKSKPELLQELDTTLRVPGWANIWTQPIINRIDMLSTGVRTMIGVKVFGRDLPTIQAKSEEIAGVLRDIRGAVDVFPDQSVGKGYVEVEIDRARAARYGINVGDVMDVVEVAVGGRPITQTVEGRERYPVRLRYSRSARVDEESIRRILVAAPAGMGGGDSMPASPGAPSMAASGGGGGGMGGGGMGAAGASPTPAAVATAQSTAGAAAWTPPVQVPLGDVADVRVVEGPAMIKSENGMLRNYVQLNVRGRDIVGFVEEARRTIDEKVRLPEGMHLEWSGQFEHQVRARQTLSLVFPAVIVLIFLLLYLTYHDLAHAMLMMTAVPGALAGGVIFQWLFGFDFSVAVWVGYIACFGMATETGIVMLVYLREAIERAGGLANIQSEEELRHIITNGAVRRMRPKLLTEGTTILGLAPMLWAHGVGAEVIRPMAAPVLGGILMADEVIDVFLPVLFYRVERGRWRRLHGKAKT